MIIVFLWIGLVFFDFSKAASFQCEYKISSWTFIGKTYHCRVKNSVTITSLETAQIDDMSGAHQPGYNDDNVIGFYVDIGQLHYFPRGLNKFFKNLKGIYISGIGLKEVHQSDLKVFPKLINLYLYVDQLEILEEKLFDFNPNLELVYIRNNKISHIDPNVFDKLNNLKTLFLSSNICINMNADNNPTAVQDVIRTAKSQCTNSDYSNLEQKVKNLEIVSKNLNSEKFSEKIKNLDNEIKNSKFSNFFQEKLQDLKAAQIKVKQVEFLETIAVLIKNNSYETSSALESKVNDVALNLMDLKGLTSKQANCSKADEILEVCTTSNDNLSLAISGIEKRMADISDTVKKLNQNYENDRKRFSNLMKVLENIFL